jgi:predicted MFS family arabinose efflux permease
MSDPNAPARLAATVSLAAFVALSLYLAPGLVAVMISQLGFQPADPGYVIAAEMAGMGLATFPALFWVNRIHWGRLAQMMLVVIAAGDAVSAFAVTPLALCTARFCTGFAQGTVSIICMSALRLTRDPNRSFGLWLFAELAVGALVLLQLPALIARVGIAGYYAALSISALMLVPLGGHIASGHDRAPPPKSSGSTSGADYRAGVAGLGGILAFYVGFSAIWTFTAQMASPVLSLGEAARAVSIAPLGGMAGAALAGAIGARFGALRPFAIAVAILAMAAFILGRRPDFMAYEIACCGVLLGWTFGIPFLFAGIARVDAGGRLTTAINITIGTGLSAGPALAALAVASMRGYRGVVTLSMGGALASYLLAIPMLRAGARRHDERTYV